MKIFVYHVLFEAKIYKKCRSLFFAILFIMLLSPLALSAETKKSAAKYAIPAINESVLNEYINKVMQALGTDSSDTKAEAGLSLKIQKTSKDFSATFEILPADSLADFCVSQACCKFIKTPADKNQDSWKSSTCKKILAITPPWKWIKIKQQSTYNEQQKDVEPTKDSVNTESEIVGEISDTEPDGSQPSDNNYRSLQADDRPPGYKEAIIAAIVLLPVFFGMLIWFNRKRDKW